MLLTIVAMLSVAASPTEDNQPLAKADQGYAQCYEPNDGAKTCQSIATYKYTGDGHWDNTALVLLSSTQPLTLETVTQVVVRNGAVCGYIRADDIWQGTLRLSSQPLQVDKAEAVLPKLVAGMTPLFGKEICTQYLQSSDGLKAKATIEGGKTDIPSQHVKWILPTDGYIVAPAPAQTAPAQTTPAG